MSDPVLLVPGLWAVTSPELGTRYFRSLTLAELWRIDPGNPLFAIGQKEAPALCAGAMHGPGQFWPNAA